MVRVVNSLFADYLEPRGLVDPRQTLLTGEQTTTTEPTITPIVQPLTAPTPTMIVDPIGYQDPAATAFDPSMIDLDALANLDLSGLEGLNLELDISNMYMPKPTDFGSFFNEYSDFLSSVASGNTSSKVNRNDDIYNNFISSKGDLFFEGTPEELRASAGLSDVFALYDDPAAQITSQSVQPIYQSLMTAEDPLALLSDYYGFEITPAQNEGSIYNNATRYGTTADKMAEFQSIIEPILQKAIPYIQATQGLDYTDALEYAYTHDPMIASLYAKYDMDLYRQTKDGSTYIYDPIAGAEIRTLEVKDPKFKDIAPALAIAVATAGVGSGIAGALTSAGMSASTASAVGSALASGIAAAAQGGDLSDVLTSMATAGVLDYGLNTLAESDTIRDTLNSVGEEFGFGTSVEQIGGSFVPSGLTESGITGGDFIGGLAQFGAEAGSGLGDVLSSVAQAMVDPSWTPASVEDANIITNFVEQTSNNTELLGGLSNIGLTTDTLKSIYDTAKSVYDSSQEEPTITPTVDINLDPTQTDPITVDEETGDVTIGLPQIEDTTDGGGATDSTTDITDTTTDTTVDTTDTTDDTAGTIFDPQHPWIYRGNGVFVHGKTGETVTEDVSEYDPYVVGESYGRGTDEPDSTTQEDTTGGLDIFVDTTDSDGDGLLDSEDPFPNDPLNGTDDGGTDDGTGTIGTTKSKTNTTTNKSTTLTTGTTQPTLPDETGGYGTGTPTEPTVSTKPTTTTTTNKSTTPTTETTEPTLPDETGGYGTGGTTDGGTDTTTTGGTGDGGGDGGGTDGGSGTGNGGGDGDGNGDGDGSGSGGGLGGSGGMFSLGGGDQQTRPTPYMGSISFAPQLLTPLMPKQSKDYLADLLGRLQR